MKTACISHNDAPTLSKAVKRLILSGFVIFALVGVTGCFDSGKDNNSSSTNGAPQKTTTAPSNHTEDIQGFLHAPGKDTPYTNWCTACHGKELDGDRGPSCTFCHAQLWSEDSASGGGSTSEPPANHTDDINGYMHADDKFTPFSSWCTACHGTDLGGEIAPSCTACHDVVWTQTSPPAGGAAARAKRSRIPPSVSRAIFSARRT